MCPRARQVFFTTQKFIHKGKPARNGRIPFAGGERLSKRGGGKQDHVWKNIIEEHDTNFTERKCSPITRRGGPLPLEKKGGPGFRAIIFSKKEFLHCTIRKRILKGGLPFLRGLRRGEVSFLKRGRGGGAYFFSKGETSWSSED